MKQEMLVWERKESSYLQGEIEKELIYGLRNMKTY